MEEAVPDDVSRTDLLQMAAEQLSAVADERCGVVHVVDVGDVPYHEAARPDDPRALRGDELKLGQVATIVATVGLVRHERIRVVVRGRHVRRRAQDQVDAGIGVPVDEAVDLILAAIASRTLVDTAEQLSGTAEQPA